MRRRAAVRVGFRSGQDENFVLALRAVVEMAVEKPQVSFEVFQIAVSQADHGQTSPDGALQRDERQSLRPARQPRDAEQRLPGARLGHESPKIFILFESLKESRHYKLPDWGDGATGRRGDGATGRPSNR